MPKLFVRRCVLAKLQSIDLRVADKLEDRQFRLEWFRAELEESVPEQFRMLRERRDLTQGELASLSGMKQSAISRFEGSNTATWKLDTLLRLAEALDAQLSIVVEAAEDVIARHRRQEGGALSVASSAIDAASKSRAASSAKSVLGVRPHNTGAQKITQSVASRNCAIGKSIFNLANT